MSRCGSLIPRFGATMLGLFLVASCSNGEAPNPTTASPPASSEGSPAPTVQDVMQVEGGLEPGTYFIDPDVDPSTPLRVVYDVSAEGWSQWIGAAKFADDGHVAVSITTVTNLTRQACRDHSPADPPVGPTVNDLATALSELAPFEVSSPPAAVTLHGYRGKYLELTTPDLPVVEEGDHREFTDCVDGSLHSWIAPSLSDGFWGYNQERDHTEEFWILDVDGTRLVIEANWSPTTTPEDMAEMQDILDSIRIEP
jgi:hypothetical protein